MAIFRDYYLNDRQYERMINLLNSLNVDSVGFEHAEIVGEIKGLFIEQMNDHKSIGDLPTQIQMNIVYRKTGFKHEFSRFLMYKYK